MARLKDMLLDTIRPSRTISDDGQKPQIRGDRNPKDFLMVSLTEVYLCPQCNKPVTKQFIDKPRRIYGRNCIGHCRQHGDLSQIAVERYPCRTQYPSCDWPWRESHLAAMFDPDTRALSVGGVTLEEDLTPTQDSKRKLQVRS